MLKYTYMPMPDLNAEQIFRYDGATETPAALGSFVDLAAADPGSVAVALRFIDQSKQLLAPILAEGQAAPVGALEEAIKARRPDVQPDVLERRTVALGVVWALLASGADRNLDYPRPVESRISNNPRVKELRRARAAAGATTPKGKVMNPAGEAEAVLKIRANHLAIAVGCLPVKQQAIKPAT